jgi:hypothetical protein
LLAVKVGIKMLVVCKVGVKMLVVVVPVMLVSSPTTTLGASLQAMTPGFLAVARQFHACVLLQKL